ncbi:protein disulfide-isomerase-like isoform X2 [Gordionus sp. m RMFG-2023]|uniref:protein disulfide-isomerase-like isoform X2 n=1 Tax=Gordionus sp. m RMFG-2023 TaxID=3053472 RepID=UPI0031FDCAA6
MKLFLTFFLVVILNTLNHGFCAEDYIEVLTDENEAKMISPTHNIFVEFYAPWCGHCKQLEPEYVKLAGFINDLTKGSDQGSELGEESPQALAKTIKIVKCDATVNKNLAEKYKVQGYPTIKFISKDKSEVSNYNGNRKAEDMRDWILKKIGPQIKIIKKLEDLENLIDSHDVVVFGYFKDPEGFQFTEFKQVAAILEDTPFVATHDASIAKHYKMDTNKHDNGLILFKKFDEGSVHHYDKFDDDDIAFFVKSNRMPLVSEFTEQNANKIFTEEHQKHILLFEHKSAPQHDNNMKIFNESAKNNRGKILFVYIDSSVDVNERILEFFGIKSEELPTLRIINLAGDMKKYKPLPASDPKDKTVILGVNGINEFVTAFLDGKLKPHLLTETLPEDWDKNPVKVLAGSNFRDVAYDPNATWCGHCKQLVPIYDELGQYFADKPSSNIVIAKLDSPANEIEGLAIKSFPTIKLYLALKDGQTEKTVIDFGGERTLEGLKKFVESGGVEGASDGKDEEEEGEETEPFDDEDEAASEHPEHTEL